MTIIDTSRLASDARIVFEADLRIKSERLHALSTAVSDRYLRDNDAR